MKNQDTQPTRAEIDQMSGAVLLEFGAEWCGHCSALRPHVAGLLKQYPQVQHIRVEDGQGLPLGRSFRVKLWPTFIFLKDGKILGQAVRPAPQEVEEGLQALTSV